MVLNAPAASEGSYSRRIPTGSVLNPAISSNSAAASRSSPSARAGGTNSTASAFDTNSFASAFGTNSLASAFGTNSFRGGGVNASAPARGTNAGAVALSFWPGTKAAASARKLLLEAPLGTNSAALAERPVLPSGVLPLRRPFAGARTAFGGVSSAGVGGGMDGGGGRAPTTFPIIL